MRQHSPAGCEEVTALSHDAFSEAVSSAGVPCAHRCCTFDNRGIGSSSIPEHFSAYKTGIMAADVRALMDHLGWAQAHVMGMSLGGEQCIALCVDVPIHRSNHGSMENPY